MSGLGAVIHLRHLCLYLVRQMVGIPPYVLPATARQNQTWGSRWQLRMQVRVWGSDHREGWVATYQSTTSAGRQSGLCDQLPQTLGRWMEVTPSPILGASDVRTITACSF